MAEAAEDAAAADAPAPAAEKTEEELKKEEQKAAMLAMAAAAAQATAAAAAKKKKGGKGKKKKGSWDLLPPKDRHTRFWVEQFGRDSEAGNAEAAKLQRIVDKKTEENKLAKQNWEKEVKKMLKFLYQMDRKVEETRTNGCQAIIDLRQSVANKKAKYEKYWADVLSLDPYEELVVDHSIGRTLSFVVLAQIAQPWGQLTEKLDVASRELEELTYFKDQGQYENEAQITCLETQVQTMIDDLNANHDFLEALMDKLKRRGLKNIARRTDEAKHAAAQMLLTLMSPSDQEEIKNHAWFRSERRAYLKDEELTLKAVDEMEKDSLKLLKEVLRQEEERLMGDVGSLQEEVAELEEKLEEVGDEDVDGGEGEIADSNLNQEFGLEVKQSALKTSSKTELETSESKSVRFAESRKTLVGKSINAKNGKEEVEEGVKEEEGRRLEESKRNIPATTSEVKSERRNNDKDPFRPPCALPYDVPERLARLALVMSQACRANTTNINNPKYTVKGTSMPVHDDSHRDKSNPENRKKSVSTSSSRNEFGGVKRKWPVTGKMMNSILPACDPRKRPPKDEAPRNFRLANGRKPWDPSLI